MKKGIIVNSRGVIASLLVLLSGPISLAKEIKAIKKKKNTVYPKLKLRLKIGFR